MPAPAVVESAAQLNNKAEAEFVESFSKRLVDGEVGIDRGRAKSDREAAEEAAASAAPAGKAAAKPASEQAKPTGSAKPDKPALDTPAETVAPSGGSEAGSEDDESATPKTPDTGTDTPAGDEGEGEPAKATDEGDGKAGADDEVVDERDIDDLTEDELAQSAKAQLEAHGLTVTMDDLPPAARPILKARLDNMTAAFTRAMMDQRAYRKDETQFRAERAFIEAHPDLMIAEMLAKDPELLEKVQARIDEAGTDVGKKAQAVVIRDERRAAVEKVETQNAAIERVNQRADAIDGYVRRACTQLNLPYDIVVDAVVNRLNEKPDNARDLTDQEIDAVIGRQQRILAKHVGEKKVTQRKEEIRGRTQDKRTVSPAAKSSAGSAPAAPAGKAAPKNDAEFIDQFLSKNKR